MFKTLREDIRVIKESDPAARGALEIWLLYSGLHAVRAHRRANWLYRHGFYFLARLWSQNSRRRTGIEIHPGATIGKGLFIDHGSGVVIGETAIIGDYCTIYQGVTLGGTGKDKGKRHPTLGNNVMVGAGAKILGPFTVGDGAKVAAGAVVLEEVPPNCTAVGVPARIARRDGLRIDKQDLDQVHIPDPIAQECERHKQSMAAVERQLSELQVLVETLRRQAAEKGDKE